MKEDIPGSDASVPLFDRREFFVTSILAEQGILRRGLGKIAGLV